MPAGTFNRVEKKEKVGKKKSNTYRAQSAFAYFIVLTLVNDNKEYRYHQVICKVTK
jgi:hypothetical protein